MVGKFVRRNVAWRDGETFFIQIMNPFNDQIGTESERIELATSQLVFRKNSSIEFVQEEVIFGNKMHSSYCSP